MLILYPNLNNQDLAMDLLMSVFRVMVFRCLLHQYLAFLDEPNVSIQVHRNKSRGIKPLSLYQVEGSSLSISGFLSYNCGLNFGNVSQAFSTNPSFSLSLSSEVPVVGL